MANDVDVKFGAKTEGLDAGTKHVVDSLKNLDKSVRGISDGIGSITRTAVWSYMTTQVLQFVNAIAQLGDTVEDTAAQLDVSTERVGELAYIAASAGDSLQSMSNGMQRLAYNSQKALAGSDTEADAFRRLGVSVKDAEGNVKSIDQLLLETADSFSQHADGAEKVALAYQLFGRAGVNMIPLLNEGRAGFEELNAVAARTGTLLSATTVDAIMQVHQGLVEMNASFQGLGIAIFSSFQPAILGVVQTVTSLIQGFTEWINRSYETGGAMRWLAGMVNVVVSAVMVLVGAFELLFQVAGAVIDTIGISLGALGSAIGYGLSGNWEAATEAARQAGVNMEKTWATTGGNVVNLLQTYKDNIAAMWGATLDPPKEILVPGGGNGRKPAFGSPTDMAGQKKAVDQLKQQLREINTMFDGVFSNIIGGADKALTGLITGTMSWGDALMTVADSVWSTFVKLIEDWVAKWLAGEATMLVAHQSTNAAKAASDMAAEDQGILTMIGNAIKSIFVSSKQTAAGVTANLAPVIGPAAIPAGLAAGAAVASLASFDVGAWNIPKDQIAKVHAGEMIVPAKGGQADAMRDMLGGGGGQSGGVTNNFYGAVLDKAGLARIVVETLNKNPSLRGAW